MGVDINDRVVSVDGMDSVGIDIDDKVVSIEGIGSIESYIHLLCLQMDCLQPSHLKNKNNKK